MQEKKRFPKLNPRRKMLLGVEVLLLLLAASGLFRTHAQITIPAVEFAGVIAEDGSSTGTVKSDKIALQAGTYRVRLSYVTPDDQVNVWSVQNSDDSTVSADGLLANTCMLYSGLNETEMMIYVTEQVEVQVCVTSAEGSTVEITGCTLARTDHASAMWITGLLIVFLLIHLLLGLGPKSKQDRATVFALTVIILIASLPILNGYTIAGADTIYHMLRIEGVKDGLLSGQFPVRLQPNWLQGYGYATGIFYCDTFLYLPALFRIIGFPVSWVYLGYKLLLNTTSVVLSYVCFAKIFQSRRAGLLCSALYSLTIYRLLILYLKDHLGQTTAMALLPLLMYAIWRLLETDPKAPEYRRTWIFLTLGETVLIQCHVLTCELALVFGILVFLCNLRKVIRIRTLLELAKSTAMTLLLNAWFLVPFLQYYATEKLNITNPELYTRTIQSQGASIPMLLGLLQFAGHSDNTIDQGLLGAMPFTLGAALLLGVIVLCVLLLYGERSKALSLSLFGAAFGLLSLWMASALFPWDALQMLGGVIARLVSALQYPTRLLEVSTLFLCLCAGGVYVHLEQRGDGKRALYFGGCSAAAAILLSTLFLNGLLETSPLYRIYDAHAMGNAYLSGREYLPVGTDENALLAGTYICEDGVNMTETLKQGTTIVMQVENTVNDARAIEVPLLYYSGYQAIDKEGNALPLSYGTQQVIRVTVPAGYAGEIRIAFVSPLSWRVAEVLSLLSWIFFLGKLWIDRKKRIPDGQAWRTQSE